MSYAITVGRHFAPAPLMHCSILLLSHICSYTLDHVKPKLEEPTEQAQAEDLTNLAFDQGKPQCF
jgi:hypothetical protein